MRTMMSVGSLLWGSGTSSTRTSRLPCHVTAFILPPGCADTTHPAYPTRGTQTGSRHGMGATVASGKITCMTTYVALLRGINVGRNKRIAMADLRALLESL